MNGKAGFFPAGNVAVESAAELRACTGCGVSFDGTGRGFREVQALA